MFWVGQKVVCIRGFDGCGLMSGSVYTISKIRARDKFIWPNGTRGIGTGVKVGEILYEKWLDATRFRPLVESKTDISVFTKMLNRRKVTA